jgi:hypothetical protein
MWRCRPLWKERSAQAPNDAAVRPALHTSGAGFTGELAMPVGSVGNRGRMEGVLSCFSNCPDSHSQVLENFHHGKPRSLSADGQDSHFSASLTGVAVFEFRFFLTKTLSVAPRRRTSLGLGSRIFRRSFAVSKPVLFSGLNAAAARRSGKNRRTPRQAGEMPGNPENRPCFPRAELPVNR